MHQGDIFKDDYWGSGRGIKAYIKDKGKDDLKREVLYEFNNKDECSDKEADLITQDIVLNDSLCLNRQPGGLYIGGYKHTEETRRKMSDYFSKTRKSKEYRDEQRRRTTGEKNPFYGRKHSEETRRKMRESAKNRRLMTDEERQKISNNRMGEKNPFYGRKHTESTKEKLRVSSSKFRHTEESKLKISKANKGFKHTEEAKEKIRVAAILRYKNKDNV